MDKSNSSEGHKPEDKHVYVNHEAIEFDNKLDEKTIIVTIDPRCIDSILDSGEIGDFYKVDFSLPVKSGFYSFNELQEHSELIKYIEGRRERRIEEESRMLKDCFDDER